jgi:hypothetical protein
MTDVVLSRIKFTLTPARGPFNTVTECSFYFDNGVATERALNWFLLQKHIDKLDRSAADARVLERWQRHRQAYRPSKASKRAEHSEIDAYQQKEKKQSDSPFGKTVCKY